MVRKLVSMLVVAGLLLIGANAFGMNRTDTVAGKGAPLVQGKVTGIKGKTITVTDAKGQKRVFELQQGKGVNIGDSVAIEEDPWHGRIMIGGNTVGVRKGSK